jgi:hypothetical protein
LTELASTTQPQIPYFGGPWFMSPFFERELAERNLDSETEAQVREYAERGYLVVDDLGVDDLDSLIGRAVEDLRPIHTDSEGEFNRVQDAWTVSDAVRTLATLPKITGLLETLYGRRPIPFQTLNFLRGSQQATHSDAYHFHSYPKHFMCGVWIAFEDLHENNGPLHYYPGSHRLPDYDFLCPGNSDEFIRFITDVVDAYGLERVQATLKKGQALIWSANLLHGGDPVADTDSTRLSQVTHYFYENCSYYSPVESDFQRGRVHFRQIVDVGTGKPLPLRTEAGPLSLPMSNRLANLKLRRRRSPQSKYVRFVL